MATRNRGRTAYTLAALLLCAYTLNVLIGKAIATFAWPLPHANDVTEFLVVFAAMVSFVTGLLRDEKATQPRREQ